MSGPSIESQEGVHSDNTSMQVCTPLQVIDKRSQGLLVIEWADHQMTQVSHLDLRLNCRCAECVAKRRFLGSDQSSISEPELEWGRDLRIEAIEAIACQALNFRFSDGHNRGIYPWLYLRSLSRTVE